MLSVDDRIVSAGRSRRCSNGSSAENLCFLSDFKPKYLTVEMILDGEKRTDIGITVLVNRFAILKAGTLLGTLLELR